MHKFDVAHIDDKAVCNDGSPGVYYHRIGRPLNSTRCEAASSCFCSLACTSHSEMA